MDSTQLRKVQLRNHRKTRVRKGLKGSAEKPRLSVNKTNQHVHIQLIDDVNGYTLASASTCQLKQSEHNKKSKASGKVLGSKIAQLALEKNIKHIVFDRGPHRYHGILAAIAEGAREAGLEF